MIEAYDFTKYFPVNSGIPEVNIYQTHHIDQLTKCLEYELYPGAYFHVHILYMLFIYLQLFRISNENEQMFKFSLIGFPDYERSALSDGRNPFAFWHMNEKTVFRFFRLVGFDDGVIGNISACVNMRNKHLHVNGEIGCNDEVKMQEMLEEYERNMEQVVVKSQSFLANIYTRIQNNSFSENIQELSEDDLELNLFIPGMFSPREIEIVRGFGVQNELSKYLAANY